MGFWGSIGETLSGWGSAVSEFANSNFIQTIGSAFTFGTGTGALNTVVGDLAVGAVVGGVVAAATGGDVLKGAAIGGGVGGVGGAAMVNRDEGQGLLDALFSSDDGKPKSDTSFWDNEQLYDKRESSLSTKKDQAINQLSPNERLLNNGVFKAELVKGLAGGVVAYMAAGNEEKENKKTRDANVTAATVQNERLLNLTDVNQQNALERDQAAYDRTKPKYHPSVNVPNPVPILNTPQVASTRTQGVQSTQQAARPQAIQPVRTQQPQLPQQGLLERGLRV